jgi:PKD repeat protein
MKNSIKYLIIFGMMGFLSSCDPKKVEPAIEPAGGFNFSAPNSDLRAPAEITFSADDNTTGATYLWDFGDGKTSTEKNPVKAYTTGGTKIVKLTVTASGKSKAETKTIPIENPYSRVSIMKSTILSAATAFPDGTAWDYANSLNIYISGGPDVYLIGRFDGVTVGDNYYTSIKTNVTATQLNNGSIFWDNGGATLTTAASIAPNLRIYLRDSDDGNFSWTSTHEQMGYVDLKLSDLMKIGNKYPTSIELKGTSGNTITGDQKYLNDALKIKIDLKWAE